MPSCRARPAFRVGGGVAEEVEEEGLGEGVELGEGGAALGPQRLRPVQHLRNPPLLRQRRQGDFRSPMHAAWTDVAAVAPCNASSVERRNSDVENAKTIASSTSSIRSNDVQTLISCLDCERSDQTRLVNCRSRHASRADSAVRRKLSTMRLVSNRCSVDMRLRRVDHDSVIHVGFDATEPFCRRSSSSCLRGVAPVLDDLQTLAKSTVISMRSLQHPLQFLHALLNLRLQLAEGFQGFRPAGGARLLRGRLPCSG